MYAHGYVSGCSVSASRLLSGRKRHELVRRLYARSDSLYRWSMPGNPGPGGWGCVFSTSMARCVVGGKAAATTNNHGVAGGNCRLAGLHTSPQVAIFTDSRYVIDGLTKWLPAWRRRGWVTSTNTPVKNRDLWMTLESLHHPGVRWQHVYGHRGDPNNERVDTIARACAAGTCPPLFCGQSGAPEDPVVVPTATTLPSRSVAGTSARRHVSARALAQPTT